MDTKNLIALTMVKGIGPAFVKRNLGRISNEVDCLSIIKDNKPEQIDDVSTFLKKAEQIIDDCQKEGIKIITILSHEYPDLLKGINDPPCILYIKGEEFLLNKCIAIIGTRHSSTLGNEIAERLGAFYSKNYSICNGLVEGIDEHSIYTKGKIIPNVVGIISGGLCYKETCTKNHIKVIEDVLSAGGLIITEYPPHVKEDQFSGSKASRIQAGLSQGLILVQSAVDGGSKYTLATFAKLGRALGVIHYPAAAEYSADSFGANRLIVEKKEEGLAHIIYPNSSINNSKKKINVKSISIIESKNDYTIFEKEIEIPKRQNLEFNF